MFWIYVIIYFLGAVTTGLVVYTLCVKQYLKEQSDLDFNDWMVNYDFVIILLATLWFIALPISVIVYFIKAIVKKINKHYNIEL